MLTVSTAAGQLISFLAALPAVFAAAAGRLAHLTSLSELAVVDLAPLNPFLPVRLQVACEPAFCAVGPDCVAVGMNSRVGFLGCLLEPVVVCRGCGAAVKVLRS
jgi:hypothetical protein